MDPSPARPQRTASGRRPASPARPQRTASGRRPAITSFYNDDDDNAACNEQEEQRRPLILPDPSNFSAPPSPSLPPSSTTTASTTPQQPPPSRACCDSASAGRVLLLLLASGMCFGSQVAYDSVGAAAPQIRKTLAVESEAIGDLYSSYHLPNMVMVILGGMLADRIGLMSAAVLFSLLICGGTTIVAFAAPYSFRGMLFGRMVFGELKSVHKSLFWFYSVMFITIRTNP